MRTMTKLFILLLVSCFLSSVYAKNAGTISVMPGFTYYHFAGKRHLENNGMPSLTLGYRVMPNVSIEFMTARLHTKSKIAGGQTHNGQLYALSGVYHFVNKKSLEPFFSAGVGVVDLDHSDPNDSNTLLNVHAGTGLTYLFDRIVSFRLGLHDYYTLSGGKNDMAVNLGMCFSLMQKEKA